MKYILVNGTHGRHDPWSQKDSLFQRHIQRGGLEPVSAEFPFDWSGALDGLDDDNATWMTFGASLFNYAVPVLCPDRRVPGDEMLVITFSNGAQIAINAFAMGLKGRLITVNPPIRSDMGPQIQRARPNIKRWVNLYGDWRDYWAVLGAVNDGHFGIRRQYPAGTHDALSQFLVPGGHGEALKNQALLGNWTGWIAEVLR